MVQIVTQALPPSAPTNEQPANAPKTAGKASKKRSVPVLTHTISSVPIDSVDSKVDNKKQFKCMDCGKCVSSSRNLTRHRESCKVKKVSLCKRSCLNSLNLAKIC